MWGVELDQDNVVGRSRQFTWTMWGVELDNIPGQFGGRTRQYTWTMQGYN